MTKIEEIYGDIQYLLFELFKSVRDEIGETVEANQGDILDAESRAKLGMKFLELFNVEVGADIKLGSSDSQKF